jgi:hypothetical protein
MFTLELFIKNKEHVHAALDLIEVKGFPIERLINGFF